MSNIPKLRFKEFSGEWEEKKLGDLGVFKGGGTPSTSNENYWIGDIPWISSSDIMEQDIHNININRYINEISVEESATKIIPKDSVLFVSRVGVGKVAINKSELCTSQDFTNLILNKKNNSYFIGYYFLSEKNLLIRYSQGTSIKGFTTNDIKTLKLNIPKKQEQEKIASFLSSIDTKIEQLNKKIELLEEYKKGIMQKIFSQEIRFKDDNGNNFDDWKIKQLGNIGKTYNGLTGKTKEDFGKGKPYIQYKQIFASSKLNIDNFGFVNIDENETQVKAKYGDIFFTTSSEVPNEVGFSSVLLNNIDELYLNSFCFGYRVNSLDMLNPNFAQYLFRNQKTRKKIIRLAQGSTRYNMSKIELMKIEIDLPCLDEQTKIANFLSSIDEKIEFVSEQLTQTKEFKKALLQQMFV